MPKNARPDGESVDQGRPGIDLNCLRQYVRPGSRFDKVHAKLGGKSRLKLVLAENRFVILSLVLEMYKMLRFKRC